MEPQETAWDLRWRMFGVSVRVTPMFWVASLILGQNALDQGVEYLAAWVGCMFVSILAHELGHIFVGQYFGSYGHIILVAFGGLAVGSNRLVNRWQRIAVSLAGPAAGFLFLAAILGVVALRNYDDFRLLLTAAASLVGVRLPLEAGDFHLNHFVFSVLFDLIAINLVWGLLNLLPVWPLDGGMVCRELCEMNSPRRGIIYSLQISITVAGFLALAALLAKMGRPILPLPIGSFWTVLMFGLLAYQSYQMLMQVQADRRWHDDRWHNHDDD